MTTQQQLAKAGGLWAQWHEAQAVGAQALSSASNVLERLELLQDPAAFEGLAPAGLQQEVLGKQLASLHNALAVVRSNHEVLWGVVKGLERLHIEAQRSLGAVASLQACAEQAGPQPTPVQCADALQDMWAMCRDEWLLKAAIVGLFGPSLAPADAEALLQCYAGQPNIDCGRVDAVLALTRELSQQQQQQR